MNQEQEEQRGIVINLGYFFRVVLKNWWIILLCAILAGSVGFVATKATDVPEYSAHLAFVVVTKSTESSATVNSDISASIKMVNTFKWMLGNETLAKAAAANCKIDVKPTQVKNSLTVTSVDDANIIEMQVKEKDPELAYAIAMAVVDSYQSVVSDSGFGNTSVNLYQYPELPSKPDGDSSAVLFLIFGFVVGALIAAIALLVINAVKDSVLAVSDIQERLRLNIVGIIPRIKLKRGSKGNLLISDRGTGFNFVESYKAIRTKLETTARRTKGKVYMVTSASENEGKTTVSINLAISLAQNKHNVLLIDADLRKPSILNQMGIKTSTKGLTEVLKDGCDLTQAVRHHDKFGLFLLASTTPCLNSSEYLSSDDFEEMLEALKNEFDFIIIDTPPAGVVTDATIISKNTDGVIMVVREDTTSIDRINAALSELEEVDTPILGCVFNDVSSQEGRRYNIGHHSMRRNVGYGYGNGYGYGYTGNDRR